VQSLDQMRIIVLRKQNTFFAGIPNHGPEFQFLIGSIVVHIKRFTFTEYTNKALPDIYVLPNGLIGRGDPPENL
jgi:hypothetical protein